MATSFVVRGLVAIAVGGVIVTPSLGLLGGGFLMTMSTTATLVSGSFFFMLFVPVSFSSVFFGVFPTGLAMSSVVIIVILGLFLAPLVAVMTSRPTIFLVVFSAACHFYFYYYSISELSQGGDALCYCAMFMLRFALCFVL